MLQRLRRAADTVLSLFVNYVLGGDISHWQGLWDAAKSFAAGWRFVFIRAGSVTDVTGDLYDDYRFYENVAKAFAVFKWFGFYWFFRPNHDPVEQAKYFANLIRHTGFTLLPIVDIEQHGNRTPTQVRTALKTFIVTLMAELNLDRVIIYTRQSFWDTYVAADPLFSSMPLFAARYKSTLTGPWSDGFFAFRDWLIWAFWQWSADGNGRGAEFGCESSDVDLDYVNGPIESYAVEDPMATIEERVAALETTVAEHKERMDNQAKVINLFVDRVKALEALLAKFREFLALLLGG